MISFPVHVWLLAFSILWFVFVSVLKRCRLGRAAGETGLQPFPQETHQRNAKAPATDWQRGVRSGSRCLSAIFVSCLWRPALCCHLFGLLHIISTRELCDHTENVCLPKHYISLILSVSVSSALSGWTKTSSRRTMASTWTTLSGSYLICALWVTHCSLCQSKGSCLDCLHTLTCTISLYTHFYCTSGKVCSVKHLFITPVLTQWTMTL